MVMIFVSKVIESKDLNLGKVILCIFWFSNFGLEKVKSCRVLIKVPDGTAQRLERLL